MLNGAEIRQQLVDAATGDLDEVPLKRSICMALWMLVCELDEIRYHLKKG